MATSLEEAYRQFFSKLVGYPPYRYQEELAERLFQHQSVVLRAPTGSGKTWATVAPFLFNRIQKQGRADRLIYVLPLRSLASSLWQSTLEKVSGFLGSSATVSACARNRQYLPHDPVYITVQMGGQQDDPFFEGDLIFTTIDQLLSSYLFAPASLPDRVGNIAAGALIGSLMVFDEVHLLDPDRSLATTIEMLDRLKGLAQFVVMSATLPDSILEWLGRTLRVATKTLSTDEVLALPSHAAKKRSILWKPYPLSADDIVRAHEGRTIAIVNTVGRAQSLFREVREKRQQMSPLPRVLLLHSRFFPEDRRHWELQLERYFGPRASESNAILISTQVVEAGIDISADVLLTELAPLNSLIQRAGRVARYESPRNVGRLIVFELPTNGSGRIKLGPYRDQAETVDRTRSAFTCFNGLSSLDYLKELHWLNEVHGISDLAALSHLESLHTHRQQVLRAMDGLDQSACARLIRDISSISVILTDNPASLSFAGRRWPRLLSVPRMSLFQLREACSAGKGQEWVLKAPDDVQPSPAGGLNISWKNCASPAQAGWLLAINPIYAKYTGEFGLELGQPSESISRVRYTDPPLLPRYSYQREAFVSHARRIVSQAQRIVSRCPTTMDVLGKIYGGLRVATLVELICALHDAGKLQIDWQRAAQKWQQHVNSRNGATHTENEPLAHTTYDPASDKGHPLLPKFPPHAPCGAFALLDYLGAHYPPEVAITASTSIARHHGAHTRDLRVFDLIPDAARVLEECLPEGSPRPLCILSRADEADAARFPVDSLLHLSEDQNCWPLYAGLVRILRLADQGSFQEQS